MTWKEWSYYADGIRKTQLKQWEHTRAINYMVYRVNADPKKPTKEIASWWPLPTDVKVKPKRGSVGKRVTKAAMAAFIESMR